VHLQEGRLIRSPNALDPRAANPRPDVTRARVDPKAPRKDLAAKVATDARALLESKDPEPGREADLVEEEEEAPLVEVEVEETGAPEALAEAEKMEDFAEARVTTLNLLAFSVALA